MLVSLWPVREVLSINEDLPAYDEPSLSRLHYVCSTWKEILTEQENDVGISPNVRTDAIAPKIGDRQQSSVKLPPAGFRRTR
jgi:hypothetical protein